MTTLQEIAERLERWPDPALLAAAIRSVPRLEPAPTPFCDALRRLDAKREERS